VATLEKLVGIVQFTSVVYLAFLALAVVTYFLLPGVRSRVAWLLLLSSGFYLLLSPRWFWVLIAVTAFTYGVGRAIDALIPAEEALPRNAPPTPRAHRPATARALLVLGIVAVAGALIAFKYLGFLAVTGNQLLGVLGLSAGLPVVRLLLPVGVSFWTFQTIAYLVDVYRGDTRAERNPFLYALAVMFFPVVTAGPITRIQTLVPQLATRHRFDYDQMQSGLLLIGWGFFKKLMVADRLGVFVNTVFDNPHDYSGTVNGLIFSVAAVFFAIQLYCDFSGYTDIVRGSARLFGVELPINFRAPYFAHNVRDFWRRWHITLMDWLRDYIYIPLGGSRKGPLRRYANIMTVFLVSGIWHGAGLSFVVWGGLNGIYLIAGEVLAPMRERLVTILRIDRATLGHRIFQVGLTFGLITFAWVFFRANSLTDALYMVPRMFVPTVWIFSDGTMAAQGLSYSELMVAFVSIGVVWFGDWLSLRTDVLAGLNRQHLVFRWATYYTLILVVVIFGHYGGAYDAADFVYFKF
jgi:D-alanyl-lipoteichoic acid acyltransferase DltB (MBOAT superfamily)